MEEEHNYVDDPVDRCALTLARPIGCSYGSWSSIARGSAVAITVYILTSYNKI